MVTTRSVPSSSAQLPQPAHAYTPPRSTTSTLTAGGRAPAPRTAALRVPEALLRLCLAAVVTAALLLQPATAAVAPALRGGSLIRALARPDAHDALSTVETDTLGELAARGDAADAATSGESGAVLRGEIDVLPGGLGAPLTGDHLRSLLHGCHELTEDCIKDVPICPRCAMVNKFGHCRRRGLLISCVNNVGNDGSMGNEGNEGDEGVEGDEGDEGNEGLTFG